MMLWEFELGTILATVGVALVGGIVGLTGAIWRFGKRTERYDEVADTVEKMDGKLDSVQLTLNRHVGVTETVHQEIWRRLERLERWRDEQNGKAHRRID